MPLIPPVPALARGHKHLPHATKWQQAQAQHPSPEGCNGVILSAGTSSPAGRGVPSITPVTVFCSPRKPPSPQQQQPSPSTVTQRQVLRRSRQASLNAGGRSRHRARSRTRGLQSPSLPRRDGTVLPGTLRHPHGMLLIAPSKNFLG